jgi:predicted permease
VTDLVVVCLCFVCGAAAQRVFGPTARRAFWLAYFGTVTPLLVFVTFSTLEVDRELVSALAAVVVSSWLVAGAGYAYARAFARSRAERGALALGASFGNTGFLGLPLAQLVFGNAGLALAVVYGRLAWLIPDTSLSTALARLHGRGGARASLRRTAGAFLLNPPLWALAAAVALRAAGAVPDVAAARGVATTLVGPGGFLLLGLTLPLERERPAGGDVRRAVGAVAIRMGGGPLALWLVAHAIGARVPGVFYFLAGMPCAFHLLVLARVYDLRPTLMRLLVAGSTAAAVAGVAFAVEAARLL